MSSASLGKLTVFIGANNTELVTTLAGSTRKLAQFGVTSGQTMQTFGRTMQRFITLPTLAASAAVLKFGGSFEKAMNTVQAVTSATADEMQSLEQQALQLGETTEFSAAKAAQGIVVLSKAGLEVNQILASTPKILQLASAAQIDMAKAADIATSAIIGYGIEASNLGRVNDVLVNAFISNKVSVAELGDAFRKVGPVAKAAGVEFSELIAALAQLANAQLRGQEGGRALRRIIVNILKPTKKATEIMGEWGLVVSDASGKMLPFVDILKQVERAQKDLGNETKFTAQVMEVFGQFGGPGVLGLLERGSDALEKSTESFEEIGVAARIAKVQMAGLFGAFRRLISVTEGAFIKLGKLGFLGIMTQVVDRVSDLIKEFGNLDKATVVQITKWVAIAATVGPLLVMFGGFVSLMSNLTIMFMGMAPLIVTFVSALFSIGTAIALPVIGIGSFIILIGALLDSVNMLEPALDFGRKAFNKLGETLGNLADFAGKFVKFLNGEMVKFTDDQLKTIDIIGKAWILIRKEWNFVEIAFQSLVVTTLRGQKLLLAGSEKVLRFLGRDFEAAVVGMFTNAADEAIAEVEGLIKENKKAVDELNKDWENAGEKLKEDAAGIIESFKGITEGVENNTPEFVFAFKKAFDKVKALFTDFSGAGAAGLAPGGPAFMDEETIERIEALGGLALDPIIEKFDKIAASIKGATQSLSEWLDELVAAGEISETWAGLTENMIGLISTSFTDMFTDIIQGTGNFAKSMGNLLTSMGKMVLDILFKVIFEKIAMYVVDILMGAAAAAGNPFLIPLFVGVALVAVGGLLSGTGFEGAADAGASAAPTAAPPPPSATATTVQGEPIPDDELGASDRILVLADNFGQIVAEIVVTETKRGNGDGVSRLALA